MDSKIARALRTTHPPVAILFSDEKPEGAAQLTEGKWGCLMWLLAGALKGKTAAVDERSFGCLGGGTGLGFGNACEAWPGGIDGFCHFLSSGKEGYLKSPEVTRRFVETLPITRVPTRYVLFKPLAEVDVTREQPDSVLFLVNPDRLSALVVLANYEGPAGENVILPWAAGCQSLGIFTYREARSEHPRAVVGMVDLSARKYMNRQFGSDLLTFSIPFQLFLTMEGNVAGSFLEREPWQELLELEAREGQAG